jgi:RNA polymerase sigma-70 factor (ECF subfamily)
VVQETFVKLCHSDRARIEGCLAQWLFTVCRNRALDVQRKENRMVPLQEVTLDKFESPGLTPSAAAEQRDATNDVVRLLATLPPNQQEVVRLKFQNGLSYQEISQITQLTVTNVGFLLHTALKTIRHRLKAETNPAHNL